MTAESRAVRAGRIDKEKADVVRSQRVRSARLRVLCVDKNGREKGNRNVKPTPNTSSWVETLNADKRARIQDIGNRSAIDEGYVQESSAIMFKEYLEEQMGKPLESGIANLEGFYHLIRHNPFFKEEIKHLKMMIDGEWFLNRVRTKVGQV
mgnify:CR=1 FL=1